MKVTKTQMPVTTALKFVLEQMGIQLKGKVFSDSRKVAGVKAVGVKLTGLKLKEEKVSEVIQRMEGLGYTYHYDRYNNSKFRWFNGHRFCFSKK